MSNRVQLASGVKSPAGGISTEGLRLPRLPGRGAAGSVKTIAREAIPPGLTHPAESSLCYQSGSARPTPEVAPPRRSGR